MSFSPNLKVLSDWRSSLTVAFSVLRRISFIVTGDFSFGNFDPLTTFDGMAATAYKVNRARYLRIGGLFLFSLDIQATLAAPFSTAVFIAFPATTAGEDATMQGVAGFGQNAGTGENCIGVTVGGQNTMRIYRYSNAAYTAGDFRARINGFLEVL